MKKQEALAYLLSTSSRFFKRAVNKRLEKYGITTSQCAILRLLYNCGELSQAEIADALAGDRATIGSVISILYKKEYLKKNLDKNDNRSYVIGLTSKSKGIISDIESLSLEITNEALNGLSEDEVKILYRALNRIIDNLS
ncbi:DNA-binding transcriptional regulator, MarR family [Anaerovirgula multivorans]|uniref:HTH-type transcriptional regulator SarZ n=1 Tax=Anaerovirgula multivorans TaxID=312168 RepID=A0A239GNZ3_9FIRM|nr:MarR family transcriptional regulator [Anaerovirgula multivorans]SNS70877.1 DNA-binding transcriptional regulator, MarR family [Anaerovirgula multivorans]